MRYKLWKYVLEGFTFYALQDTTLAAHQRGAWFVRDQSSYPEDNNRLVWKHAHAPMSVGLLAHQHGSVVAQSDSVQYLPADAYK